MERTEHVALLGLVAAVGLAVFVAVRAARPPVPVTVTPAPTPGAISVHVVGEVVLPGLYLMKSGSRVQDAISAAHGPTIVADLRRVNLAAPLRDGDRVVIPRIELPPFPFDEVPMSIRATQTPGARRPGTVRPPGPPSRTGGFPAGETPHTVNVNSATAADLEQLPGVGPVLARRIVERRELRGLFRRLDDLLEVKGVGPKLFHRLQPLLRLDDEGTPPTVPP
jgi:competence protein ComEA